MENIAVSKSRKAVSYIITFSAPLSPASASNVGLYRFLQGVTKVVKKHKQTVYTKALKIKSIVYNAGPDTVTISMAKPSKGAVQVTIEPGLVGADGASSTVPMVKVVPRT